MLFEDLSLTLVVCSSPSTLLYKLYASRRVQLAAVDPTAPHRKWHKFTHILCNLAKCFHILVRVLRDGLTGAVTMTSSITSAALNETTLVNVNVATRPPAKPGLSLLCTA